METISASVLDEAVERLVKEFQPEEIYLFGSMRGESRPLIATWIFSSSFARATSQLFVAPNARTAF